MAYFLKTRDDWWEITHPPPSANHVEGVYRASALPKGGATDTLASSFELTWVTDSTRVHHLEGKGRKQCSAKELTWQGASAPVRFREEAG